MEHKILCYTGSQFAPEGKELLEKIGSVVFGEPSKENLADKTMLVVQLGVNVDKEMIDFAPNLKFIATATTGLDHIDTKYAESKGIEIVSLKGEVGFLNSITSTAELALGLIISLTRKIPSANKSVLNGEWDREKFRGTSLRGKTLGIIGYGRLGKMMERFGKAFEMNVVFSDSNIPGGLTLEELLEISDIVSLHVPLDESTEGLIGAHELQIMKPNAILINTSRGKIVDEEAVIGALKSRILGGYGTDVLSDELEFTDEEIRSRLIEYSKNNPNVLITPHIGGTTAESRVATDIFIAKKLQEKVAACTTVA